MMLLCQLQSPCPASTQTPAVNRPVTQGLPLEDFFLVLCPSVCSPLSWSSKFHLCLYRDQLDTCQSITS